MLPKFFILICFTLSLLQLRAQDDPSYTQIADGLFQHLNKKPIKTDILYDRVFPSASLHIFNTTNMDTSDVNHWQQSYSELYNASYNNAAWITPTYIKDKISGLTSNKIIPIGILNYRFNHIDTNAIEENLIVERNDLFYDVAGRPESPYWVKEVSIASILTEKVVGLSIDFQMSLDLFLNNTKHSISVLQADFNDGTGLKKISLNKKFTINYNNEGVKTIKFIIRYSDGNKVTTYSTLTVAKPAFPPASLVNPLSSCNRDERITATIAFNDYQNNNFKGQGNYHYYFATNRPCNGKVYKPFIVLDGIDENDDIGVDSIYQLLNADTRLPFAKTLQSIGYDVVILNFPTYNNELGQRVKGGADYIERNAMVLAALINRLNQELIDNASTEKIVLLGPSMGGLISQYALAYMEKENIPHNTRLWISFDAPHNGANISIGVQYFVKYFAENLGVDMAEEGLKIINSPAAKQMLLHHYRANSTVAQGAPGFREQFKQALVNNGLPGSNGFPMIPRKVALVDGSLSGALQKNLTACERAFRLKGYLVIKTFLFKIKIKVTDLSLFNSGSYINACRVFDGHILFIDVPTEKGTAPVNSISYDIAPGGKRYTLQSLAGQSYYPIFDLGIDENEGYFLTLLFRVLAFIPRSARLDLKYDVGDSIHCFIPTKSALAFKGTNQDLAENIYLRDLVCTGETPFDSYFGDTKNYNHVEVHPQMALFVLDEINGIHRQPTSAVDLGADTVRLFYKDACTILSIKNLNSADIGRYTFNWSTGETAPTITVCPTQTTTYTITVRTGSCTSTGKITVQVLPRCNEDLTFNAPTCQEKVKITWSEPKDTFPNNIPIPKGFNLNNGELKFIGGLKKNGYYLSTDSYLWLQARDIAKDLGGANVNGHLVTISSAEENNLIYNYIKGTGQWPWIGLQNKNGHFQWVNNESISYTNWEAGEPNNFGGDPNHIAEPYVHMYDFDGKWNDRFNTDKPFVAEFEKPIIQYKQIAGPNNGSSQKAGVYTICYERRNLITNRRDTCCFNVTVNCTTPPIVSPTMVTKNLLTETTAKEFMSDFKVEVYPNPSSSDFTVNIKSEDKRGIVTLTVIDALGRIVEERIVPAPNQTLKLGDKYIPGVYLVQIAQGHHNTIVKIIKQIK